MGFFDFFKGESDVEVQRYNSLFLELTKKFPHVEEDQLLIMSCIAGLFARVAYVDFELDIGEMDKMKKLISNWHFSDEIDSEIISTLAVENIKEMAGLDNHLYIQPLKEKIEKDDRFSIVKSLFLIAAADGSVENIESEEIRKITKGLELSSQYFIAARAEVSEYLKILK